MIKPKTKGLGRGLEALLGAEPEQPVAREGESITALPLSALQPGRYQPRTRMDETALQELAASLRTHGLMQPIVVRPMAAGRWEIIAGERRFRAAHLAGLTDVPVVVRDVPNEQALALALIENIQREDLNPLEEAQAIRRLIDEFNYSHDQAADAIGRSRSATSNLLRLLNLAEPVQTMLLAGDIDMGHARALLAVDRATQIMLANEVVEKRLSVRDTEKLVQRTLAGQDASRQPNRAGSSARNHRDLTRVEERLADALATPVSIRANAQGRGKLTIDFSSIEQFQGLLERLGLQEE
ncbi:MAG: ParB/RepB/Spo0J family partition protein [Burkholderiaceae bacterium]